MKPRTPTLQCQLTTLLLTVVASQLTLFAAPPPSQPPAKLEIRQSVFAYPNNPPEGRDPFFPNSMRVYGSSSENSTSGPSLTELTLRTIIGTPPHVVAIINNHSFAPGDEGDVTTRTGQRLHIHCVGINPKAGTATVEANGVTDELHLSGEP